MVMSLPGVVYVDPAFDDVPSIYVSPQVEDADRRDPGGMARRPYCWARHVHPDDYDRVWDEYVETIEKGLPLQREYRMIHEDGTVRTVVEQALIIPGDDGQPFLVQGVLLDVTDRRNADELAFLAYHDPLTGLPNRAAVRGDADDGHREARRSGGSLALLFLDLDNFKQVNDTMGHHVGDVLLRDLTERLKPCLRESDVLARRSGDEFLILLTDLDGNAEHGVAQAKLVAERIRAALEEPFGLGEVDVPGVGVDRHQPVPARCGGRRRLHEARRRGDVREQAHARRWLVLLHGERRGRDRARPFAQRPDPRGGRARGVDAPLAADRRALGLRWSAPRR